MFGGIGHSPSAHHEVQRCTLAERLRNVGNMRKVKSSEIDLKRRGRTAKIGQPPIPHRAVDEWDMAAQDNLRGVPVFRWKLHRLSGSFPASNKARHRSATDATGRRDADRERVAMFDLPTNFRPTSTLVEAAHRDLDAAEGPPPPLAGQLDSL